MKKIILLAALTAAGCTTQSSTETSSAAPADPVQRAIAGRTAEKPVDCLSSYQVRNNRGLGTEAILFEGTGRSLVYVNRPPAGCPEITQSRAIRINSPTGRLCRGDIVTVFDPVSKVPYGSCSLGEFTPYRR